MEKQRHLSDVLFNCILIFLFWCSLSASGHAAAWVQDAGKGLIVNNLQFYEACQAWTRNGTLISVPCFRQFAFNPYIEYGATSDLTLILSPNSNTFRQSVFSVPFGYENTKMGLRFSLWKKDWDALSTQFLFNQPSRFGHFGDPRIASISYALVNRQTFLDARLLAGTGGALTADQEKTWYANAEASFQANFLGAADEWHFNFMAGLKTLHGRLVYELQELNAVTLNNPSSPLELNYNVCTILADIIYWHLPDRLGLQIAIQQDFYGRKIGRGTQPFVAMLIRF